MSWKVQLPIVEGEGAIMIYIYHVVVLQMRKDLRDVPFEREIMVGEKRTSVRSVLALSVFMFVNVFVWDDMFTPQ